MISRSVLCRVCLTGMVGLCALPAMAGVITVEATSDIWMGPLHPSQENDGISVWAYDPANPTTPPRYGAVDFNLASVGQPILGAYLQLYAPNSGNNSGAINQQAFLLTPPGVSGLNWGTLPSRTQVRLDSLGYYTLPAGSPMNQWYNSAPASWVDVGKLEAVRTSPDKNLTFLFKASSGKRDWDDDNGWAGDNPPRLVLLIESDVKYWNVANGDWNTPANWFPLGVPTSNDVIYVTNGGAANASGDVILGHTASDWGVLRLSNGSTLNVGGNLQVGNYGMGTLVQSNGVISAARLAIGGYGASQGVYQMDGGQLNITGLTGRLWVGDWGKGTFIQTGGVVSVQGPVILALGQQSGYPPSEGRYEIHGGQLTVSETLGVGWDFTWSNNGGQAVFLQTGGTVTADRLLVAVHASSRVSTYMMSGGSLTITGSDGVFIGDYSPGTFIQTGGNVTINGAGVYGCALCLGWAPGTGTYRISGGSLSVPNGAVGYATGTNAVGRFEVLGSASTLQFQSYRQNGISTLVAAIGTGGVSTIQLTSGAAFLSGAMLDMDIYGGLALTSSTSFTLMQTSSGSISGTPTQTDAEPGLPYTVTNTGTALTASWSGAGYGPVWDSYAVPSELTIPGGAASGYLTILGAVPGRDVFVRLDLRDNSGPLSGVELAALADFMQQAGLTVYTNHPFLSAPYDLLVLMKPTASTSYLAWDFTDYDDARQEVTGLVLTGLSIGVPEPSSFLLLALGVLAFLLSRAARRRNERTSASR